MLRRQFLCHVLKALFFIKITLKLSYICKKMQNFRALGAQTPIGLWRLGTPPPDSPNSLPIANFWLRAWCRDGSGCNVGFYDNRGCMILVQLASRLCCLRFWLKAGAQPEICHEGGCFGSVKPHKNGFHLELVRFCARN